MQETGGKLHRSPSGNNSGRRELSFSKDEEDTDLWGEMMTKGYYSGHDVYRLIDPAKVSRPAP